MLFTLGVEQMDQNFVKTVCSLLITQNFFELKNYFEQIENLPISYYDMVC